MFYQITKQSGATLLNTAKNKMKIQLSIEKLQHLIDLAKLKQANDNSLSNVLEFTLVNESETNLGDDHVAVWVKSGYAECDSQIIYSHWIPVQ